MFILQNFGLNFFHKTKRLIALDIIVPCCKEKVRPSLFNLFFHYALVHNI